MSEKAEAENFEVESEAVLSLQHTFVELKKLENFGNGRDAVRMWKEILQCRAQRVVDEPEEERTITESDAEKAGESILAARLGSGIPGKGVAADEDPMKLLDGLYRMDQIREQLSRLQMEMAVAEREGSERPEIVTLSSEARLVLHAKEAHAAHLDELRRARDRAKLEEERRRAQAIQEKIRWICSCPAGFNWYKSGGGWRCGSGSHFVSEAQLNNQFTR
ncbi:stage v sporulation protein k [Phytophthora cinnamomi]|uniref:stage v sporulation protein k n=1 Tax=Phytophthora cinnamomi TaxID=4785 RepID=UPI00355AACC4|nr:stage v sporulation protein k [Phytophthora cinnamomi]